MDFDWMDARNSVFASQQQMADRLTAGFEQQRLAESEFEDMVENSEYLKELVELHRIADAAQKQAELAEKQAKAAQAEAENAQKEAKAARRQGTIANVTAVVSAIIAAASWLIPRELIAAWASELLK